MLEVCQLKIYGGKYAKADLRLRATVLKGLKIKVPGEGEKVEIQMLVDIRNGFAVMKKAEPLNHEDIEVER